MNAPIYLVLLLAALVVVRDRVVAYVVNSAQAAEAPAPAPRPRLEAAVGCSEPVRRPVHCGRATGRLTRT